MDIRFFKPKICNEIKTVVGLKAIKRVKGQNGRRYIIKLYESQVQGECEVNRARGNLLRSAFDTYCKKLVL